MHMPKMKMCHIVVHKSLKQYELKRLPDLTMIALTSAE